MLFANPILLAGLAGALAPLVLHLLARARYRTVAWGAMRFLDGAEGRRDQSTRLRQSVLLLLRMLTVALLAMALARPVVERGAASGATDGDERTATVLVLDRSASMGFAVRRGDGVRGREESPTRYESARAAAVKVLQSMRRGDAVAVIETGAAEARTGGPSGTPPGAVASADGYGAPATAGFTADLAAVAAGLPRQAGAGRADLPGALVRARELLSRSGLARGRIVVLTDSQASNWAGADAAFAAGWRGGAGGAGDPSAGGAPMVLVAAVGDGPENETAGAIADLDQLAIEDVRIVTPPLVRRQEGEVEIVLRNRGAVTHSAVGVRLSVRDRVVWTTSVPLTAGETRALRAPVRVDEPGSQVLSVVIDPPAAGLAGDLRYELAVDVVERPEVLILSGDEREEAADGAGPTSLRSESAYVRLALNPSRRKGQEWAGVTVVRSERWTGLGGGLAGGLIGGAVGGLGSARTERAGAEREAAGAGGGYAAVFLLNVPTVSIAQSRALERYVYSGGTLVVAPGSLCRVETYNEVLYRGGSGLLPGEMSTPTPADGSRSTSVLGLELGHPVFAFLREGGTGGGAAPMATVGRYFPVAPRADARTLGFYRDGGRFLVEGESGRGRVYLMTTPLDADWSGLPLTGFYLPFVQGIVRTATARPGPGRNLRPGEPITLGFDAGGTDGRRGGGTVSLRLPDDSVVAPEVTVSDGRTDVRYDGTAAPGRYTLSALVGGREQRWHFIVRPPREESDLTPLGENRWRELSRDMGIARVSAGDELAAAVGRPASRREWWLPLLGAMIAVSLLELGLARRWQ